MANNQRTVLLLNILMSSGNAGSNKNSEVTPLALPASLGGHQSHIAAALTSSQQHLEQQKHLHTALQVDISSIGKQQLCSLTRYVDSPKTAKYCDPSMPQTMYLLAALQSCYFL